MEVRLDYYTRPRSNNTPTEQKLTDSQVYSNSPYKITLPLGLLGYCETNATTTSPTKEVAYRVNIILQLLAIWQSTILDEELSINNIISNEKRNTDYFTKHLFLN